MKEKKEPLQVPEWFAPYVPLLQVIHSAAEQHGEAETLKWVVRTRLKGYLRDLMGLQLVARFDYANMDADTLVHSADDVGAWVLPSFKFRGVPDLGESVPPFLLDRLLKRPNPLWEFHSLLFEAEHLRLLYGEIERRSRLHPELKAVERYRLAQPDKVAQYEALEYIRTLPHGERGEIASGWGLRRLAMFEKRISEITDEIISSARKLDTADYLKVLPEIEKRVYCVELAFPKLEEELATAVAHALSFPQEEIDALTCALDRECRLFVLRTAIEHFGYALPDEAEINEAVTQTWNALRGSISPNLRKYSLPIPEVTLFQDENDYWQVLLRCAQRGDASQEALPRLSAQMDEWAIQKDVPQLIIAGLTGELRTSLRDEAQRGIDAWRKREATATSSPYTTEELERYLVTKEATEPENPRHPLVHGQARASDEEGRTLLEDTLDKAAKEDYIPLEDQIEAEDIDLSQLGFDIDSLNPREYSLLQDVSQGLREGYDFASKKGGSFRDYWGKDYSRKIKQWERLKEKVKSLTSEEQR